MCSHFNSIKNFNQTLIANGDFKQTVVETGDVMRKVGIRASLCVLQYIN